MATPDRGAPPHRNFNRKIHASPLRLHLKIHFPPKTPHFSERKLHLRTYTDWTADVQPSLLNFSQKNKNHEHRFQHSPQHFSLSAFQRFSVSSPLHQLHNHQLTMRPSKISRLPHQIREQLNLRLQDNHRPSSILQWLNSLPEATAILAAEFDSHPITKQNLSDWRFAGFRDWQLKQQAHDFFQAFTDDTTPFHEPPIAGPTTCDSPSLAAPKSDEGGSFSSSSSTNSHAPVAPKSDEGGSRITHHGFPSHGCLNKLLHWLILQYATTANLIAAEDDPRAKWNRLREFCADIARLRRSDLYSQYLDIQRDWLDLERSNSIQQKEKQFEKWVQRKDVMAKLNAKKEPGGLTDETIKEIVQKLNLM
jgi:hypothetical protein